MWPRTFTYYEISYQEIKLYYYRTPKHWCNSIDLSNIHGNANLAMIYRMQHRQTVNSGNKIS